jgi:hypothetical protein
VGLPVLLSSHLWFSFLLYFEIILTTVLPPKLRNYLVFYKLRLLSSSQIFFGSDLKVISNWNVQHEICLVVHMGTCASCKHSPHFDMDQDTDLEGVSSAHKGCGAPSRGTRWLRQWGWSQLNQLSPFFSHHFCDFQTQVCLPVDRSLLLVILE